VLLNPSGPSTDSAGNLLFADNGRIQVVAASTGTSYGQSMTAGDLYTVAGHTTKGFSGDGGPATKAELEPNAVTVDQAGNLVICDEGNFRVRVVAEHTGIYYGQSMTAGDIYSVAGNGTDEYSGDGGPATNAGLSCTQVAVDAAGNLVIGDYGAQRVRVVAEHSGTYYGQSMTAGYIYTVAGDGGVGASGDGGPALDAEFDYPVGVAVDAAGNLVITDQYSNLIRVVAERTGTYYGQSMTAGDVYAVAGNGTDGYAGDGGPALGAELDHPNQVAIDSAGNLVITDTGNDRIRVVAEQTGAFYGVSMTAGNIYTVAGDAFSGFTGDGGQATKASLFDPQGVAVSAAGNLLIADAGNSRIREVTG
jgi:sugar lactone lactonase YvrE